MRAKFDTHMQISVKRVHGTMEDSVTGSVSAAQPRVVGQLSGSEIRPGTVVRAKRKPDTLQAAHHGQVGTVVGLGEVAGEVCVGFSELGQVSIKQEDLEVCVEQPPEGLLLHCCRMLGNIVVLLVTSCVCCFAISGAMIGAFNLISAADLGCRAQKIASMMSGHGISLAVQVVCWRLGCFSAVVVCPVWPA